jgi:D-glycero-alpha-D-manno-heptose-7-phosphate kinase
MLIARAPVRVSLAGGGTDLPAYYRQHGGLVVSTSVDKYFYVIANLNGAESVQITSSDYRTFIRHPRGEPLMWEGDVLALPRAMLHEFGIDSGLQLFLACEVPPGTGLGSSSTVSVALAKALAALSQMRLNNTQLAELASYIEIEKLHMPIGRQDQYAAAFGGLNAIHFSPEGVYVEPIDMPPEAERALERRIMLFFTRASHLASSILRDQQAATAEGDASVLSSLHEIKAMAQHAVELLRASDLAGFGALLHDSWQAKKRLAKGISNAQIDQWYELARANGAVGGKIAGAGGGGFLMLYCEELYQEAVTIALASEGLIRMDFHFERSGATILIDAIPRVHAFSSGQRVLETLARIGVPV